MSFQLKSNLINKRTLIVIDCSPFEARGVDNETELRNPGTNLKTKLIGMNLTDKLIIRIDGIIRTGSMKILIYK